MSEFTYRGDNNEDIVEEDMGQLIRRLAHIIELRVLNGVVEEIDHTERLRRQYGIAVPGSGLELRSGSTILGFTESEPVPTGLSTLAGGTVPE